MYTSVNCRKGVNSEARSIKIFYPIAMKLEKKISLNRKNIQLVSTWEKEIYISNWRIGKIQFRSIGGQALAQCSIGPRKRKLHHVYEREKKYFEGQREEATQK